MAPKKAPVKKAVAKPAVKKAIKKKTPVSDVLAELDVFHRALTKDA